MEAQWWPNANSLAADADRERAVEALKQNFQAGRIKADELSDRIGLALNARTFGDLDNAMENLPPLRPLGSMGERFVQPFQQPQVPVPYGQTMYPVPVPLSPTAPQRRKRLGLSAFVLGLCGFLCGAPAVVGLGFGVAALFEEEDREDRGYAIAGLAMSVLWLVIFAIVWAT
ncbi:DUF1707 and DUF4190 domain-containing protein [Nocardia sp. NPDC050406]|uniref:DUF1707 and DUF4190 domain-containing protein n=1 Tax=Nocardia sp. NPDC050406 TaxID=3364318 RepID=UPI003792F39C